MFENIKILENNFDFFFLYNMPLDRSVFKTTKNIIKNLYSPDSKRKQKDKMNSKAYKFHLFIKNAIFVYFLYAKFKCSNLSKNKCSLFKV